MISSGATVRQSVLSPSVRVDSHAAVGGSILFSGVHVGQRAVVLNAIVDKDCVIDPGAEIGVEPEADRERFTISAGGVVVIPKGTHVTA